MSSFGHRAAPALALSFAAVGAAMIACRRAPQPSVPDASEPGGQVAVAISTRAAFGEKRTRQAAPDFEPAPESRPEPRRPARGPNQQADPVSSKGDEAGREEEESREASDGEPPSQPLRGQPSIPGAVGLAPLRFANPSPAVVSRGGQASSGGPGRLSGSRRGGGTRLPALPQPPEELRPLPALPQLPEDVPPLPALPQTPEGAPEIPAMPQMPGIGGTGTVQPPTAPGVP